MTFIATSSLPETLIFSHSLSSSLRLALPTVTGGHSEPLSMRQLRGVEAALRGAERCNARYLCRRRKRFLIARTHTSTPKNHVPDEMEMSYALTPVGLIFICKRFNVYKLFGFLIAFCSLRSAMRRIHNQIDRVIFTYAHFA